MTRFLRWTALVLCVPGALLVPAPPAPAQRAPSIPFAHRADAFRRILYELGFVPVRDFTELGRNPPGDCVLVVLGRTDCLHPGNLPEGLKGFVEQGGVVLVATDRAPGEQVRAELRALAGVSVSGEPFAGAPESNRLFHGLPYCPILMPAKGAKPDLFRAPPQLGSPDPLSVATNAPSCLEIIAASHLRPLAWLPVGSYPERNPPVFRRPRVQFQPPGKGMTLEDMARRAQEMLSREPAEKGPLFAVGGEVGRGRALVLADHSIFINEMMIQNDNRNAEFAWNCLQWLQGEGEQRRHKALFIEEGKIHTDFNVPLKEGPGLPPGAIREGVALIEHTLARLEDRGALDATVLDHLGANRLGGLDRILRRALEVLTVLLLVYLVYRVGIRGRFRLDATVPLLAHEVARHAPTAPLLEQRRRWALESGNLWETAHGLARAWLASLPVVGAGGTPAPQGSAAAPPRIVVRGGWRQRFGLRRRFRRLWRLAHDTNPVRIRPRALRRLLRDLDEMKAALAAGSLRLER
jgi:hypothetical protein